MTSLFIIGNGFDLSHGLKTSYMDFREYLLNKPYDGIKINPDLELEMYLKDLYNQMPLSENIVAGFISEMIESTVGMKWGDLESSLPLIDIDSMIPYYDEDELIEEYEEDEDIFYDMGVKLKEIVIQIPKYFSEWIDKIDVEKVSIKRNFSNLYDNNSLFLSFNYTETLEKKYGIQNVCHIHGKSDEELLFGHGERDRGVSHYAGEVDPYGIVISYMEMKRALEKNTEKALRNNIAFFEKLDSKITNIYSYGFSYSVADCVYIQEICNRINSKKAIWYLNDYDSIEIRELHRRKIMSCGFEGEFDTYHIE